MAIDKSNAMSHSDVTHGDLPQIAYVVPAETGVRECSFSVPPPPNPLHTDILKDITSNSEDDIDMGKLLGAWATVPSGS